METNSDMGIVFDLIEKGDISQLEKDHPRIKLCDLVDVANSKIDVKSLGDYTVLELKVLYFLLTKDRKSNAVKTRKKETVVNAVREVVFNDMRAARLRNRT